MYKRQLFYGMMLLYAVGALVAVLHFLVNIVTARLQGQVLSLIHISEPTRPY